MTDVKIIGHRGFPELYPENSAIGVKAAFEAGADGVEIDIQSSRDGIPIVFHDATLERVTGITGKLAEYDFDVLKMFSAHEPARFEEKFLPLPISSFHDLCDSLKVGPEKLLFVEIKRTVFMQHDREIFLARVWQALENIPQEIVIISYDEEILKIARKDYFAKIGWVVKEYSDQYRDAAENFQPDILICNYKKFKESDEPLWPGNWEWFVYDITDGDIARDCVDRGASYIETWNVEKLKRELEGI